MSLMCALNRHAAEPRIAENAGLAFAACRRCRCALIRRPDGDWQTVPRGLRVAWRAATPPLIAKGAATDVPARRLRTARALAGARGIDWQALRRTLAGGPLRHGGSSGRDEAAAAATDARPEAAAGGRRRQVNR